MSGKILVFWVGGCFLEVLTHGGSTVALNEVCFDLNRKFISVVAANRHNYYGSWETMNYKFYSLNGFYLNELPKNLSTDYWKNHITCLHLLTLGRKGINSNEQ